MAIILFFIEVNICLKFMMKELSMHVLDIVQNSIKAGASKIDIVIEENVKQDYFYFSVTDNGCGMSEEMVKKAKDPFMTSRTTRKVGLGIPMLMQTCVQCGGNLTLTSKQGEGTFISAKMQYSNIDRPPIGDIANSIHILLVMNTGIHFTYKHIYNENEYFLDTAEINEVLDGIPLDEPDVMAWLKENIKQGLDELNSHNQ